LENHDSLLEQTNIQHAIVGDVVTDFAELLNNLSKARLAALASTYKLPGRSKMKKDELASALLELITDKDKLASVLLRTESKEWELFQSLLQNPIQHNNYVIYSDYYFLMEHGLVFTYFTDNKLQIIIPDQVLTAYKALDQEQFQHTHDRYLTIHNYLLALTNLYGMFKPAVLFEIFNEQNEVELSEEELQAALEFFFVREQIFVMKDEYIVDSALLMEETEREFKDLQSDTRNKPYFAPTREELLKYADDSYFEVTQQLTALKNYLAKELCSDAEMLEYLIDDIQLACSLESSLQEIVYEFEKRNIQFHNKEQAQKVMALIADVYNHTRLWSNCGHTPTEMSKLPGSFRSSSKGTPFRLPNNQPVSVTKIGRNDPCTCGSGLKYKKCCGK
jgi:uncharacterized protein YecA (UPF0149 family)